MGTINILCPKDLKCCPWTSMSPMSAVWRPFPRSWRPQVCGVFPRCVETFSKECVVARQRWHGPDSARTYYINKGKRGNREMRGTTFCVKRGFIKIHYTTNGIRPSTSGRVNALLTTRPPRSPTLRNKKIRLITLILERALKSASTPTRF